jgi:hypothetical protein
MQHFLQRLLCNDFLSFRAVFLCVAVDRVLALVGRKSDFGLRRSQV